MIARITKRGEEAGENKRNDDNMETLMKRFKTFQDESVPIVKFYEGIGRVKRINAEVDGDSVYKEVVKSFEGQV